MRNNNFDILRLLCALMVLVSHSYALIGLNSKEPLLRLTQSIVASEIGLCGFFTLSGYLIFNSLVTSKNVFSYLGKRCLRIFPGLFVCVILIVLTCSLFYNGEGNYWHQEETYSYIVRNMSLYDWQWDIPGIFTHNQYNSGINGSLWTLAYEFSLYFCIIGLFYIRDYRNIIKVLISIALILSLTKNIFFANNFAHTILFKLRVNAFSIFAQYFLTGILLQTRTCFRTNKARLISIGVFSCICIILIIVGANDSAHIVIKPLMMLCVSVIFIMVGEMYWQPVSDIFKRVGDLSYGVYIYSFPIQQMIIASIPGVNPMTLMILTIVCVIPVAIASWKLVEAPSLSLKKYL